MWDSFWTGVRSPSPPPKKAQTHQSVRLLVYKSKLFSFSRNCFKPIYIIPSSSLLIGTDSLVTIFLKESSILTNALCSCLFFLLYPFYKLTLCNNIYFLKKLQSKFLKRNAEFYCYCLYNKLLQSQLVPKIPFLSAHYRLYSP